MTSEKYELDDFGVFKLEKIAETVNSNYKNFYYDSNHEFIFLFDSSNKITYNNLINKKLKVFDSFTKNDLINFFFIECYKSIIFIYEKGDLYIIPVEFVECDNFEFHWKKLLSADISKDISEKIIKSSIYDNFVITDLLFCNEKSSEENEKYLFSTTKSDKHKSYIYHQNILNNKSIDLSNVKSFKNTNLVFWANNNSVKFADKMVKFLIMNINNTLIFLQMNNLECEIVLKFNYFIHNILFIDYKCEYQYIILETECDFYRLVLLDKYNDINILDMEPMMIIPFKLNLFNYSNLTIQTYNKEQVIVNLNNNFYFVEIFHPNDIDVPLLHINLNNIHSQIFSVITYEKIIILICFENNEFSFKIFSSKFEKLMENDNKQEQNCEWYNTNFQNLDKFLFVNQIFLNNLIKFHLNQEASNVDIISLFDHDISKKVKEKFLKDKINICKAKPMSKNLITILTEKSLYVMNVLFNFNLDQIARNLQKLDFNYKNLRKFELFYDSINQNYNDVYSNLIESIITDNNSVNKEKKLKLVLLILPHSNLFENLIKLFSKSDDTQKELIKTFINYKLSINNKSTKKEFLYATILIYLFESTRNHNLLKNYRNFYIYFENINLIKSVDYFNLFLMRENTENQDYTEYKYHGDDAQDDNFSIKSLNQLNYSSEEINISGALNTKLRTLMPNLLIESEKINLIENHSNSPSMKLTFSFNLSDQDLLYKSLLILYNKKFFNILILSLINNKHISNDFEKKIKESEHQKVSSIYTLKNNHDFLDYFFKKVSKYLFILDNKTFLKIIILRILFYSEKSEIKFLEELFYKKVSISCLNDCFSLLQFLIKLTGNGANIDNLVIEGSELLSLTYLYCLLQYKDNEISIEEKSLLCFVEDFIIKELVLIDKIKDSKFLVLLFNLKFYLLDRMLINCSISAYNQIDKYISFIEKINTKNTLIYKVVPNLKMRISNKKSKNEETLKIIYKIMSDNPQNVMKVDKLLADYSDSTNINLFKFKEILTNLKKNSIIEC